MCRSDRYLTLPAGLLVLALGSTAGGAIIDDIYTEIQTAASRAAAARDRATEARDRAAEARDVVAVVRDNVRNGVLMMTGEMRDLVSEVAGDLSGHVDALLDGRDAFVADGGCSVAVCQPSRTELATFLQDLEDVANAILVAADVQGTAVDLSTEIALVQNAPGRLLFPLYVAVTETDLLASGIVDKLSEAADGLVVIREILDGGELRIERGESFDSIMDFELLACGPVLNESVGGVPGPDEPRRARRAAKAVFTSGAGLKLIGKGLDAYGETKAADVFVMAHGYVGAKFQNNRSKKLGAILVGLGDCLLNLSDLCNSRIRHCTLTYAKARAGAALDAANACTLP